MSAIEIAYQAHLSKRSRPVNLREQDSHLFEKEYIREIHASHIRKAENADIVGQAIFSRSGFHYFWEYTYINDASLDIRTRLHQIRRHICEYSNGVKSVDRALWLMNEWSQGYFHWVTESLTRLEMVTGKADKLVDYPVILPHACRKIRYIEDSLRYIGADFIYAPQTGVLRVRDLLLPSHVAPTGNFNAEILKSLAARYISSVVDADDEKWTATDLVGSKIWVSRARAEKRKIVNEKELYPILRDFGFEVYETERLTFGEQVRLFNSARVVAGLHGAGLSNMLFMNPGGNVIEVRRENDCHSNCYFSMSSALNHNYYYAMAEPLNDDKHAGNCYLAPEHLRGVLSAVKDLS